MTDGTLTMGQYLAAKRHKAAGLTYKTIAAKVDATENQVRNALDAATTVPPRKKPGRQPKGIPYHKTSTDPSPFGRLAAGVGEAASLQVPKDVLLERERRLALSPRSFTAAWQGDPLPGYSALDKRQGA